MYAKNYHSPFSAQVIPLWKLSNKKIPGKYLSGKVPEYIKLNNGEKTLFKNEEKIWTDISLKSCTDGKSAHTKIFIIIHIRKMQIKATIKYDYTCNTMAKIKDWKIWNVAKDVEKQEVSYIAEATLWNNLSILQRVKHALRVGPSNLSPRQIPRKVKIYGHIKIYVNWVFIAYYQ